MVKLSNSRNLTKRRNYQIHTTLQEGALAVSGESNFPEQQIAALEPIIIAEFNAIAAWVLERDGIIGHIKGFITAKDKSLMLSVTGAEIDCRLYETAGQPNDGVKVSVACIVFNIPQLELEEKLMAIFDSLKMVEKK